jgi:predicted transcriptional regulator
MSALINAGLMSRTNRQYELTSLGRIVYDVHLMIGKALNKFWELKALDSLETEHKLPIGERNRIISTLIDNEDIMKVLVKQY